MKAELMQETGGGSDYCLSPMSGIIVNRGSDRAQYNCFQRALTHLSKSLAMEWTGKGGFGSNPSAPATATPLRPEMVHQSLRSEATPIQRMAKAEEMVKSGAVPRQRCHLVLCTGLDLDG